MRTLGVGRFLPVIGLMGLLLGACASPSNRSAEPTQLRGTGLPQQAAAQAQNDGPVAAAVLAAVNNARRSGALTTDARLQRAASVHATDMAVRNFWGHHNPEGQGPLDRVLAIDETFRGRLAENNFSHPQAANLSPGQIAREAVTKWSNSPGHRTTMESSAFTKTGIGVAWRGSEVIIVQVFSD